ncbi:MAG: gliding motility-associated C-terminal domain-containing protein [Bacteroidales bacterium]|nr:gliding motility-associated C-terminal domain-containing protein [Bacteroidales bacterium]
MKYTDIKSIFLSAVLPIVFFLTPHLAFTQEIDYAGGANLGFMATTPPDFTGWVGQTGSYKNSTSTSPNFSIDKTWNNPAEATPTFNYNNSEKCFIIQTDKTKMDAKSNNKLKTIPTDLGYDRSVRIGTEAGGGDCSQLYYNFSVTADNCLLTFNYAIVIEAPHAGYKFVNPAFEIDVVDEDDNLVMPCTFFQMCGDVSTSSLPKGWYSGVPGWVYCDWQQIKVNLMNFINQDVKIRIRISDCSWSGHGGYGYMTCKCEPPSINVSGCAGEGDTVTTAEAPAGFDKYEWFSIPYSTLVQSTLEGWYSTAPIISSDSILAITNEMMGDDNQKFYAVKLTAPTQHVSWDANPAPACVVFIPATVNDMRPDFTGQKLNGYIPVDPENPKDEVGFLFSDVKQRTDDFPLDWQMIDFGDGDSLELSLNEQSKWVYEIKGDEEKTRVSYNTTTNIPDTIFHVYAAGDYTYFRTAHAITLTDDLTCTKEDSINIHIAVRPTLLITSPDTVCVNSEATFSASSPGYNSEDFVYEWYHAGDNPETATPYFTGTTFTIEHITQDTVFHVKVTNPDGNAYRWTYDTVRIQTFPDINIEGDSMICIGENLHLTATDLGGYTLGMKWTFQRPSITSVVGNGKNPAVYNDAVKQDTTIYILAETTKHCVAWDSVNVKVVIPKVSASVQKICPGQSVTLTGEGAATYSWQATPLDATLTEDVQSELPVTVQPEQTTNYTMSGYGENGCVAKTNIKITVIPYPEVHIAFNPAYIDVDNPILMITDSSTNAYTSKWSFSDGGMMTGKSVNYQFHDMSVDEASIHLESYNELNCMSTGDTTVPIVLFSVWVPNAFSPDNDGDNDRFFFMTQNDLQDVVFNIFNRWGEKVYSYEKKLYGHSEDGGVETLGWDGTYKDKDVPVGTYVWRLSYKRVGSTKIYDRKGSLTLIR